MGLFAGFDQHGRGDTRAPKPANPFGSFPAQNDRSRRITPRSDSALDRHIGARPLW